MVNSTLSHTGPASRRIASLISRARFASREQAHPETHAPRAFSTRTPQTSSAEPTHIERVGHPLAQSSHTQNRYAQDDTLEPLDIDEKGDKSRSHVQPVDRLCGSKVLSALTRRSLALATHTHTQHSHNTTRHAPPLGRHTVCCYAEPLLCCSYCSLAAAFSASRLATVFSWFLASE
jgi:hypothetical protein